MKYMTVAQLGKACENHKYLLLRFASGYLMGINCRIKPICIRRNGKHPDNMETDYIGFIPCDLNEYITHKHPFM